IQADLKVFARVGVHGMTAITAITAQNTVGVDAVEPVSGEMIFAQVAAVAEDIGVDAVKIGMVGNSEAIESVVAALTTIFRNEPPVVLDPVMVSESGSPLLEPDARETLAKRLLPLASVVTPNIPEARVLTGLGEEATQAELAQALVKMGASAAVVTGGHSDAVIDVFYDGQEVVEIPGERHPDGAAHGSGCTHSSSLAAYLALGWSPLAAAVGARELTSEAVRDGLREIGSGAGPVDVFGLATGELTS
ncbi:MAG TPA: bifunctional hydroxymethylpyrimidine kinase/phosphomethylpyrimidine kinase, partial [Solirubrobacterales bacterium]|nr:bifunctional hydroxymethylpyrimidine kinase/phosphomethylpyrimidine kinase [Solirubrobacterales bacterium]